MVMPRKKKNNAHRDSFSSTAKLRITILMTALPLTVSAVSPKALDMGPPAKKFRAQKMKK